MNIKLRAACACALLVILPACGHLPPPVTPSQIRDPSVELNLKPSDEKRMTPAQRMALAERARDVVVLDCFNDDAPCRAALAQDPKNVAAHQGLGMFYLNKKHKNEARALREFQEVTRLRPNYRFGQMMLARTLADTGKKEEAVAIYKKLATADDETGRAAKKQLARLTAK